MADKANSKLLVPMKVDAFVLNKAVCSGASDESKIAPITQPNYVYLRLDKTLLRHDVLDHVDLHHTVPAAENPRFTDLGTGKERSNRQGVYLHWVVPRIYRRGVVPSNEAENASDDISAPALLQVPTRWLVVRSLVKDTIYPSDARDTMPEVEAWVVESDRQWNVDDLDRDVDLQVDVSPFVSGGDAIKVSEQAEVFIGKKTKLGQWNEEPDDSSNKAPRVKLSLLQSSNPVFADYQLHNGNVFSIVDDFGCSGGKRLSSATAHYYVVGWHAPNSTDPLYTASDQGEQKAKKKRAQRLAELHMKLKRHDAGARTWQEATESAAIVCHGALYNVKWDNSTKPRTVLADKHSKMLNKKDNAPVAVGSTPLDSLLAYVSAHRPTDSDESKKVQKMEETIIAIQSLLHAHEDGVDARMEAGDHVYNWNYARVDGGYGVHLSSDGDASTASGSSQLTQPPPEGERAAARCLNQVLAQLSLVNRDQRQARWNLFSAWWKRVTDDKPDNAAYKKRVHAQVDAIRALGSLANELDEEADTLARTLEKSALKQAAAPFFYNQRDPTLLIGGVPSGWPYDFRNDLLVRLDYQTVKAKPTEALPKSWKDFVPAATGKLPKELQPAAKALLVEFVTLSGVVAEDTSSDTAEMPLYHDQGWNPAKDKKAPWRDQWGDTQPWFPVFVEWEVEYTHIPFDLWSFETHTARLSQGTKIRGGIRDDVVLFDDVELHDKRIVSGRSLVLPEVGLSLQAMVSQIIDGTPESVLRKARVTKKQLQHLKEDLFLLPFISTPLSGFHDSLITRLQGNHVKPINRLSSTSVKPLPNKQAVRDEAGLTDDTIGQMLTETNPVPLAFLTNFKDSAHSPFKPATHGQFCFRKINIIDKFGQALHAMDPKPRAFTDSPPPLYPCISNWYEPQTVLNANGEALANTITRDAANQCRYVQTPPHINQPARLNAAFVVQEPGQPFWRPVDEWDSPGPVWGWVVANQADQALQFFLPDGSFYREVCLGGPQGTQRSARWAPFDVPKNSGASTKLLDRLIDKLGDAQYLLAFAGMIEAALKNMPALPSSYADFLNAATGKPLALVNMAWSLELAERPYANEASLNPTARSDSLDDYKWTVKFGDKSRALDGLIGYFNSKTEEAPAGGVDVGPVLDLDAFYTEYGPATVDSSDHGTDSPLRIMGPSNYPQFKAFWLDPLTYKKVSEKDYAALYAAQCKSATLFGALIDPFVALHAFSSFCPVQTLQLPSWTWETAMRNMTAFFHLGPIIVPGDVCAFDAHYQLGSSTSSLAVVPKSAVPVPVPPGIDWAWLQPYDSQSGNGGTAEEQAGSENSEDDDSSSGPPAYMALGLGDHLVDERPRFQTGPYTAVEGYLQAIKRE